MSGQIQRKQEHIVMAKTSVDIILSSFLRSYVLLAFDVDVRDWLVIFRYRRCAASTTRVNASPS